MPDTDEVPEQEYLTEFERLDLIAATFHRLGELIHRDMLADRDQVGELTAFQAVLTRLKWEKRLELWFEVDDVFKRRYESKWGELRLIHEKLGEQLDLKPLIRAEDVEERLQRYRRLVALRFDEGVRQRIERAAISSPIEQLFLLEWCFQRVEERFGVELKPQYEVATAEQAYRIDFLVAHTASGLKLAIELDGHDFHEKTKQQAASDKRRERALVADGYTLFRFTGSEVVRQPAKSVEELVAFLEKRLSP